MTKQQMDSSLRPWISCIGISFQNEQDIIIKIKNHGSLPTLSEESRVLASRNLIMKEDLKKAPVDTGHGIIFPNQTKVERITFDIGKITKARTGEWDAYIGFILEYAYGKNLKGDYGFVAKYNHQTKTFGIQNEWTK